MSENNDQYILSVPLQGNGQTNDKICWYACYKMMYQWKNLPVTQIDERLAKVGYDLAELKNRGLMSDEYKKVAHALKLAEVTYINALNWSLEDARDRLQRWGPIFLATMEVGGHAMLLYGVDFKLNHLVVADPYTVGGDSPHAHNEYFSLKDFRKTLQPVDYGIQCF